MIPRRAPFDLSASESMRQSRTGEDGYIHVPDLEKKQEDYLSSKEGRKLQRLIARHNWDVKAVLSERPDVRDLFSFDVDNFHFQMPRRRRRTGSHQEAGLARPRERSVSSESPALTEQRRLLREEYPAADYVAIDVPAAGMTTSLTFEADVARVRFQVNMELAAQGSFRAIKHMYDLLCGILEQGDPEVPYFEDADEGLARLARIRLALSAAS